MNVLNLVRGFSRKVFSGKQQVCKPIRRQTVKLSLEGLEERIVPDNGTWQGAGSLEWNPTGMDTVATQWGNNTPGAVAPGAGGTGTDVATFDGSVSSNNCNMNLSLAANGVEIVIKNGYHGTIFVGNSTYGIQGLKINQFTDSPGAGNTDKFYVSLYSSTMFGSSLFFNTPGTNIVELSRLDTNIIDSATSSQTAHGVVTVNTNAVVELGEKYTGPSTQHIEDQWNVLGVLKIGDYAKNNSNTEVTYTPNNSSESIDAKPGGQVIFYSVAGSSVRLLGDTSGSLPIQVISDASNGTSVGDIEFAGDNTTGNAQIIDAVIYSSGKFNINDFGVGWLSATPWYLDESDGSSNTVVVGGNADTTISGCVAKFDSGKLEFSGNFVENSWKSSGTTIKAATATNNSFILQGHTSSDNIDFAGGVLDLTVNNASSYLKISGGGTAFVGDSSTDEDQILVKEVVSYNGGAVDNIIIGDSTTLMNIKNVGNGSEMDISAIGTFTPTDTWKVVDDGANGNLTGGDFGGYAFPAGTWSHAATANNVTVTRSA